MVKLWYICSMEYYGTSKLGSYWVIQIDFWKVMLREEVKMQTYTHTHTHTGNVNNF